MEVLRQELVNQLEVASGRCDWEAAEMYRSRLGQVEDLMLALPRPQNGWCEML